LPTPKESARQAQDQDEEEPRIDPKKAGSKKADKRGPRPLRYLFYLVWLALVPGGLAIMAVRVLKPEHLAADVGLVRTFIAEQQVPATIMFFTIFAMVLWNVRYILPFATSVGVLARDDLPPRLRSKFDDGVQLIAESRRIVASRKKHVDRHLTKRERGELDDALAHLEEVMRADDLDEKAFLAALKKADKLVHDHLGRWRKGEVREYAESIFVAVAVALVLRFFVVEAFKIPSGSMIPTLMIGDHIFVAKYAYGPLMPRSDTRLYDALPPERGDVMVFKFPENKEQDFIKRVIALPGDKFEAVDGRPVLNDWLVPNCRVGKMNLPHGARGYLYVEHMGERSYLTMYDDPLNTITCQHDASCGGGRSCVGGICGLHQGPYEVAENEAWVMGDNRNNSHDSRSWKGGMGAGVPFENIKGRAMFVWWSWDPRGGVALDRIFVNVMGTPKLPPGVTDKLTQQLDKCIRERPPVSETTPPPRK
jgi:signal peptidase I